MSHEYKWDASFSEEMEDEDLIMEEDDDEDEEEEGDEGSNAVYPEDYSKASGSSNNSSNPASPRFNMSGPSDFSRFDMGAAGASPLHGWNDGIDEKGESVALLMHLEKTVVHQDFFNNFSDDFDQDDLA
ncbi:hypothetical protein MAM1_0002d00173 [Mucor ambiguus]|uniref:Uncharacterized protein n=1 Tax=Mucor ambiguus TaxID=91626 RepID=A0A0C9LZN6_9FUNG|nr:hypothetical protein MAM1_0002d00173 [Mucor ambiguus]